MTSIANIKQEVQEHGRSIARLPSRSASRTIRALQNDDYGVRLISKMGDGWELWEVVGEAFEPPLREKLCVYMPIRCALAA